MKKFGVFLILFGVSFSAFSQVGIGTVTPHESSILEVESTDKGVLLPRMDNPSVIQNPATGLMIYNKTYKCLQINIGTPAAPVWECMGEVSNPVTPGPIAQSDCEQTLSGLSFVSQAEWTDGARVVEIVNLNGTTTWNGAPLSALPTEDWRPQGGIFSMADQNEPCFSTKNNNHSAITWTNSNVGGGSGGFVVDTQSPKEVNFVSVFNTPSDGTVTHFELKYHPSTDNTPPAYSDPGWVTVFAKTPIEYYLLDSTYTINFAIPPNTPTATSVNRFTSGMTYSLPETVTARYWRGEAWNDNSLAGMGAPVNYIEVRQLKLMKFE
jgi:hypothetical protein